MPLTKLVPFFRWAHHDESSCTWEKRNLLPGFIGHTSNLEYIYIFNIHPTVAWYLKDITRLGNPFPKPRVKGVKV
jgi:hypothetical protein